MDPVRFWIVALFVLAYCCQSRARRSQPGLSSKGKRVYGPWSFWSRCTRSCIKRRNRSCLRPSKCKKEHLYQEKPCRLRGTKCRRKKGGKLWQICAGSCLKKWHYTKCLDKCDTLYSEDRENGEKTSSSSSETDMSHLNVSDNCGLRSERTKRIIGGRYAEHGSWPWQVAFLNRWDEHYCGGTLIDSRWILTAAHCVFKRGRKRHFTVRLGEYDLSKLEGSETELRPKKILPHEDYDEQSIYADIALVKLESSAPFSSFINTACLKEEPYEDSLCYTVGWGKERETHVFGVDVLKEVQLEIQTRHDCQKVFDFDIDETEICAGGGGADACAGDSGGGLVCRHGDRWFVEGVTSYGEGCGEKNKFGIYSSVSSFFHWINRTMSEN